MYKSTKKATEKLKSLLGHVLKFRVFHALPDRLYLKIKFWLHMGNRLHLQNPISFNEKLQWLKLNYHSPLYTLLTDKYAVRQYVADAIGEKYLIPLIGVWDRFEEIDFNALPDQFVLKCTHDSGSVLICSDKKNLDIAAAAKKFKRILKRNYYYLHREWSYKNIKPRIICEQLIATNGGAIPVDYKIHCFNGNPDNVMVCANRFKGRTKFYYFNRQWELLKYNMNGLNSTQEAFLSKPNKLDEMLEIARILSTGLPYVRVDLYCENDRIYFGEMTLYANAGFDAGMLAETDRLFGQKIVLPSVVKPRDVH